MILDSVWLLSLSGNIFAGSTTDIFSIADALLTGSEQTDGGGQNFSVTFSRPKTCAKPRKRIHSEVWKVFPLVHPASRANGTVRVESSASEVPDQRIQNGSLTYGIFKRLPGSTPVWVEAVVGLEEAAKREEETGSLSEYCSVLEQLKFRAREDIFIPACALRKPVAEYTETKRL